MTHLIERGQDPSYPTKAEMELQVSLNEPFQFTLTELDKDNITFELGDHLLDVLLEGREYRYGVFDCYEAIRSWKWQIEGEYMPRIPRDMTDPIPLYQSLPADLGYTPVEGPPQAGDVIMMRLTDPRVVNHAAVFVGDGTLYHHFTGRLSGFIQFRREYIAAIVRKV